MAASTTTSSSCLAAIPASTRLRSYRAAVAFGPKSVSFTTLRSFRTVHSQPVRVFCVAKPETVEKVCSIVKKQLALSDDQHVNGESKFSALGADSLDTVEIVMGLEEEFGISVEEENAQTISTVQDAADLIEKLVSNKSG